MTIAIGERLPEGTLMEATEFDASSGCPMPPKPVNVTEAAKGRKIVIFGIPGAFTPLCSANHLPGYVANIDKFKAKGVAEVWCHATNDAFVMAAWGKQLGAPGKVRTLGDGSAAYAKALGLTLDLTARGMGVRTERYAMIVDDGVVKYLGVEQPGKFEVSSAEAVLAQL